MERCFSVEQPSVSSYLLPAGMMTEDILKDLNDRLALPQVSVREKRLFKLILVKNYHF